MDFYPRGFDPLVFSLSFLNCVYLHTQHTWVLFIFPRPSFCLLILDEFLARGLTKYRVTFYLTKILL